MNALANWLDNDANFIGFLVTACAVGAGLAWVFKRFKSEPPSLSSRGEEAGVPEERDDEMAVARSVGVTVPDVDGSHESLPEDKETEAAFWALAKTAGIEVER
jgi:hypothetical protein